LAKKKGVVVIQDSCDTQGAKINGRPSGSWADIVTTSSYFTHTITTGGVGGTVMMNDKELRRKAEVFATWGRRNIGYNEDIKERFNVKLNGIDYDGKFVWDELGFNLRATDMQAAFGLEQLKKIDKFNRRRREVTEKLMNFFGRFENDFILPEFLPNSEHSLLAFPLSIRPKSKINRKKLLTFLELNRIQTRLLFTGNALFHPAFSKLPHRTVGNLSGATFIMKRTFLLPNHHALTNDQLDYLFDKFSEFMKKNGENKTR
jgi:CDP-6-deoxy-D-xylo-4-hexulose-3-dehydrase